MLDSPRKNILKGLQEILTRYYYNNIFSSSSVGFFCDTFESGDHCETYCGTTDNFGSEYIDEHCFFDLASLTKPFVTLLSILTLIERKKLSWADTAATIFPEYSSTAGSDMDIFHLLCHSSGLPAHRAYWTELERVDKGRRREWLANRIINEKRAYIQGAEHVYSDLGYLLLGYIVEEKTGQNLADFWKETIARPLGLEKILFFPARCPASNARFSATCHTNIEREAGRVHDDNCYALGGVGGHAGLFGTVEGVLILCQELLRSMTGKKNELPFSSHILKRACRRVNDSDWTAGFSLPSVQGSSSGSYFSEKSLGHLGFTGTSFWIDPEKKLVIVLLTNRIIKGENRQGIQQMRPEVHDYIAEQLGFSPTLHNGCGGGNAVTTSR